MTKQLIHRTKDTGHGWRRKFKYSKTMKTLDIVSEDNRLGYWKESTGDVRSVWLCETDIEELKDFLYEVENDK